MSAVFIEHRRRALKRFLLLVMRHPILSKDDITKIFISAGGQVRKATLSTWPHLYTCTLRSLSLQDVGAKLKDKFKTPPDEFTFNAYASKAEVRDGSSVASV